MSCSDDRLLFFYCKENNEYQTKFEIPSNFPIFSVVQTKKNEICYLKLVERYDNFNVCFYDLKEKKINRQFLI